MRKTARSAGKERDPLHDGDNLRLGLWVMPDNASPGKLETFLQVLIRDGDEQLLAQARECAAKARQRGAFADSEMDRAVLYTWLAWQEHPGQAPGTALTARVLDAGTPLAQGFVDWFRKLFDV